MIYEKELNDAITVVSMARDIILDIYEHNDVEVEMKADNSPITIADRNSDEAIRYYLKSLYPDYGFLTEESEDDLSRLEKDDVWIVDPLDGTKNFIHHDDEFAIHVALCHKHEIVLGVIMIPAKGLLYWAIKGEGAFQRIDGKDVRLHVSDRHDHLRVLISVYHYNDMEAALIEKHKDKIESVEKCGSSMKACLIASGKAELSYRMNPNTKEWDSAPAQLLVKEAGGVFVTPELKEFRNNRRDVYNREGYIIANCIENVLL